MHRKAVLQNTAYAVFAIAAASCTSGCATAAETKSHPHELYEEAIRAAQVRTIDGAAIFAGAGIYASGTNEWQVYALGFTGALGERNYVAQRTAGDSWNRIKIDWADGRTCPALMASINELPLIEPPRIGLPVMQEPADGFQRLEPEGPAPDGTSALVWGLAWPALEFGGPKAEAWTSKFRGATSRCWSEALPVP